MKYTICELEKFSAIYPIVLPGDKEFFDAKEQDLRTFGMAHKTRKTVVVRITVYKLNLLWRSLLMKIHVKYDKIFEQCGLFLKERSCRNEHNFNC